LSNSAGVVMRPDVKMTGSATRTKGRKLQLFYVFPLMAS
jgi:hypothetical protein